MVWRVNSGATEFEERRRSNGVFLKPVLFRRPDFVARARTPNPVHEISMVPKGDLGTRFHPWNAL
jgi:hypothetical protein